MNSPSNVQALHARQIEHDALELRKKGWSHYAIAKELGVGYSTVFRAVKRALARLNEQILDSADELRRLELERLDTWQKALAPAVAQGDPRAIQTAVKLCQKRCDLLGLDAPRRIVAENKTLTPEEARAELEARGLLNEEEESA